MKLTLEQVGKNGKQAIVLEHEHGSAEHSPDLVEFARYCEDILHKARTTMNSFGILVAVTYGLDSFAAVTTREEAAYVFYNYFNGKYEVDMKYDEDQKRFFITGVVKE